MKPFITDRAFYHQPGKIRKVYILEKVFVLLVIINPPPKNHSYLGDVHLSLYQETAYKKDSFECRFMIKTKHFVINIFVVINILVSPSDRPT